MGLGTTHNCFHESYHSFKEFKIHLAHAAGYMTADVKQEDGYISETILLDWGHLQGNLLGKWKKTPEDPLLVLFAHHDCDGAIMLKQTKPLADALRNLLHKVNDEWIQQTEQFIAGLLLAHSKGEDVQFY